MRSIGSWRSRVNPCNPDRLFLQVIYGNISEKRHKGAVADSFFTQAVMDDLKFLSNRNAEKPASAFVDDAKATKKLLCAEKHADTFILKHLFTIVYPIQQNLQLQCSNIATFVLQKCNLIVIM